MGLLIALFIIIVIATAIVQYFSQKVPTQIPQYRKLLHLVSIICCALATDQFSDKRLLTAVFLASSAALFIVIRYKWLNISRGKSLGIALFPLAFSVLLGIGKIETRHIVTAMLVLALSDALAGWVGSNWAKKYWTPLFEQKSVLGSLVFWGSAAAIIHLRNSSTETHLMAIGIVALLGTGAEMFSWRGSDNFWIPVVVAVSLQAIDNQCFFVWDSSIFLLGGVLFAPLLWYKKWLTNEGVTAAVFMGLWITAFMGFIGLLFPVLFLMMGTFASRLHPKAEDAGGRNAVQVFSNGGAGMLLAVLSALGISTGAAFVMVFAAANADTMSSEIGKYFRQPTFDIVSWKKVPPGLSGGISLAGTLAGLAGSGVVAVIGIPTDFNGLNPVWIIGLGGFLGMLIDSVLGSLWQAKYAYDHLLTESGDQEHLVKGFIWCNNDMVNFLSLLAVAVLGIALG